MSLLVISLARKVRLDVVMEAWLGGSSILVSSQDTFSVHDMRSETSMVDLGCY